MDLSSLSSQAYKVIINISLFFSHLSFKISICNEIYYLLTKLSVALLALLIISADGRFLDPMIIWLASTHRANWTTHSTPRWHYAYSDSGYTDSYLSLQWLKLVFDPQTKERANQKPRVLICDGFGTHETVETLEFCLEQHYSVPDPFSHLPQAPALRYLGIWSTKVSLPRSARTTGARMRRNSRQGAFHLSIRPREGGSIHVSKDTSRMG